MSGQRTGLNVQSIWAVLDRHPVIERDPDDAWTHFQRIMHIEDVVIKIDRIISDGKNAVDRLNQLIIDGQ